MSEIKKRRGRPRKNAEKQALPLIIEDDLPEAIIVDENPEEEYKINHDIDLTDIQKSPPTPQPSQEEEDIEPIRTENIYMPPPPSYSVPVPKKENKPDNKEREKRDIISKINRYKQSFVLLSDYQINENDSVEKLEAELEQMKLLINNKNCHAVFRHVYLSGVKGYEFLGGRAGAKLYGLSDLLSKSQEVDDILKQIECEHNITGALKPEQRLLLITASMSLVVDNMNRRSEALNEFKQNSADPQIVNKYADL